MHPRDMQPRGYSCPGNLHTAVDRDWCPSGPKASAWHVWCLPALSLLLPGRLVLPTFARGRALPKPKKQGEGAARTHRAAQPGRHTGKGPCGSLTTMCALI